MDRYKKKIWVVGVIFCLLIITATAGFIYNQAEVFLNSGTVITVNNENPQNNLVATMTPSSSIDSVTSTPNSLASSTVAQTGKTSTSPASPAPAPAMPTAPVIPPVSSMPTVATSSEPAIVPVQSSLNYNFGISVGDTLPALSSAALGNELSDIASLNVGWVRLDFDWNDIQHSNSSTYNWSNLDRIVSAANARGIKLLPILDYTPYWARPSSCTYVEQCAPADPNAFAVFAAAAVERYAPLGIHNWEIWNEPNYGSWKPAANPVAYTSMLQAVYPVIKSGDPTAIVITGGLAPSATRGSDMSPIDFLTAIYADGAKNYFDAVGFHPYSYPDEPSSIYSYNAWQQMANTNPSLFGIMTANGDSSKKIWMTEYGASTGGPGAQANSLDYSTIGSSDNVTEYFQSVMIGQAITLRNSYSWAGPLFIYSYKDLGIDPSTNENFFGIVRYDGSDKPAYTTIQQNLATK